MEGYDEDLLLNPFYKALSSGKGKNLFQLATDKRWMVCIPRKGTTSRSNYNKEQFEMHLLKPLNENNNTYSTANNRVVQINGKFIVTLKGFEDVKSIQILFEETFFNRKEESYHVLCIDQLLEGSTFTSSVQPVIQNLETLQNCIDFLWPGGGKKSQTQINEIIHLFNSTYTRLAAESVRHTMDAANTVFTRGMQACLKESHTRRPANANKAFMDNVKVAVETYVMDGIYKRVFKGISSFLTEEDAAFNKTTRNLADLQVSDLGISKNLCKCIPKAKKILSNLNKFTTPLEKLYVLKLTISSMCESSRLPTDGIMVTADDLLPALVFLVVKSEIPDWLTNLTYMQNFHFSKSKCDEFQFYLSSTEAAIEHVRTGRLDTMISLTHTQRKQMLNNLFKKLDDTEKAVGTSAIDIFFENVRSNRIEDVIKMLNDSVSTLKEISELMCHPLCACDNCEKLISNRRRDTSAVTIFSRDDLGCTSLHQAAEFGCEEIMFELIKRDAVVNTTNYHSSTPLHLACQRGHHQAVMLLVHYGADINAADNGSNTPLHLAVANGHDKCTTYLCSKECAIESKNTLNVDAINEHGDTALHIASNWGFGSLAYILLKAGASIEIENKNKMTPRQCALNVKIQEILLQGTNDESKEEGYIYLPPAKDLPRILSSQTIKLDDSPTTTRKKRELTSLLKVVASGDIKQVRQRLGVPEETEKVFEDDMEEIDQLLCHPLCQCGKCVELQKKSVPGPVTSAANMANDDGVTALHIAALHGFEDIVRLLLKQAGANPNAKTKTNKRTPLHLACQYNSVESVSILLKNGATPNIKDAQGNTPLHYSCSNGHIGPAVLLLQNGASVHTKNLRGNTPLHDAARWNFVDISRLLMHYNAPLDAKNKMHLTVFQYATGEDVRNLLQEALINESENPQKVNTTKAELYFSDDTHSADPLFKVDNSRSPCKNADNNSVRNSCAWFTDYNSKRVNNGKSHKNELKSRRSTVTDLFHSLEEESLARLQQLTEEVKNFDRRKSLRRVSTIDKSSWYLDQHRTHVSIATFNQASLKPTCENLSESLNREHNHIDCDYNGQYSDNSPLVGSAASSDNVSYVSHSSDPQENEITVSTGSHFEEWFDNEFAADSADEAVEDSTKEVNGDIDRNEMGVVNRRSVEELLNEAIDDEVVRQTSPSGVQHVLIEDDDLFVPHL